MIRTYRLICIIAFSLLLLPARPAFASETTDVDFDSRSLSFRQDKKKVRFAYDVGFEMNFDNREFYKSKFSRSMTIFGARLTPAVGLSVRQSKNINHKVMLGVDILKDFGSQTLNKELFREMTLYYQMDKKTGKNLFSLQAGIFPRSSMEGAYSEAFFSDSLRFYDNNIEGLLLKLHRPKAYFELGCDWMGQYNPQIRERFMIFTSGQARLAPVFSLGYSAYMYHFANSYYIHGLVDNFLINPYMKFDLASYTGMQKSLVQLGWLQALQNDRDHVGHYVFPGGAELEMEVKHWNVGVRNRLFMGSDMMPYYNNYDMGGIKYGSNLYMGDPFYRVHDDGKTGFGTYDRLEAYYEPNIGSYLKLRVAAVFHFNNMSYSGTQQMVGLKFDLHGLMGRK